MANITMRKSKDGKRSFYIRCMVNGVTYSRTYPSRTEPPIPESWSDKRARTEATKVASLFEDACKHNTVTNDRRTVSEYATYVVNHKEASMAIKPSTVAGYLVLLDRIENDPIGKVKLRDLSPRHLNDFYERLLSPGANKKNGNSLAPKTVHEYHVLLSAVLSEAVREHIIQTNPATCATPPKVEPKEPNYYSPEQMQQIGEALMHESIFWQAMSAMFIATGARRGEILALRWSDIDFENCVICIRRNITRAKNGKTVVVTPKSSRWRIISVTPEFFDALLVWREDQVRGFGYKPADGYIFALQGPETYIRPDSVTRYYSKLGDKYDLGHLNPHAFRHSQASVILQSGDIVAASRRLGHAKPSTTMNIYGHMLPAADRGAADRIASAFLPSPKSDDEKTEDPK